MKKVTLIAILLSAGAMLSSCTKRCDPPANECIDRSKINPSAICTQEYDPVCGCDGKTYGNPCTATNAGVLKFTRGECGKEVKTTE